MESHKLAMLQEQLAAAMTEQAEAEAVVREIERDLEAEFADQYQRLRQAKADAKALEEMARLEIEAYYARTGEKCWLYDGAPVPAIVTTKPTAEIQRKALMSWLDEQKFNAEHERQEV